MIDLEKLELIEASATRAPWKSLPNDFIIYGVAMIDSNQGELFRTNSYGRMREDAKLIEAMRNNIVELISELKSAREVIRAARLSLDSYSNEKLLIEALEKYFEAVK